jgi:ferredoxin
MSAAMDDLQEMKIGGLTVRIDRLLCVGFGDCIERAPEAFEFDDEGIAVFTEGAEATARERLLESCRLCPVDALIVLDGEGLKLVP